MKNILAFSTYLASQIEEGQRTNTESVANAVILQNQDVARKAVHRFIEVVNLFIENPQNKAWVSGASTLFTTERDPEIRNPYLPDGQEETTDNPVMAMSFVIKFKTVHAHELVKKSQFRGSYAIQDRFIQILMTILIKYLSITKNQTRRDYGQIQGKYQYQQTQEEGGEVVLKVLYLFDTPSFYRLCRIDVPTSPLDVIEEEIRETGFSLSVEAITEFETRYKAKSFI